MEANISKFILYTAWASLFLGPLILLISGLVLILKKDRRSRYGFGLGLILTVYALVVFIPEAQRANEGLRLKEEALKQKALQEEQTKAE